MIEKIEINLLPAEYRIHKKTLKIPRAVIYPALLFVVLAVGVAIYSMTLMEEETELKDGIEKVTAEIQANRHIQAEINRIREEMAVTDQKIRALERISVDREKWVRLLETLSEKLPSLTWLVSVREEAGPPRLNIEARTYLFPSVALYMSDLEKSDLITGVTLVGIEQMQGQSGRAMFRFTLVCALENAPAAAPTESAGGGEAASADGGRRSRRSR